MDVSPNGPLLSVEFHKVVFLILSFLRPMLMIFQISFIIWLECMQMTSRYFQRLEQTLKIRNYNLIYKICKNGPELGS